MKSLLDLKILLIEDNPADVFLLRQALESDRISRFYLTCVEFLDEGIRQLETGKFDAVLVDLNLPDSTGTDTFLSLHPRFPDTPMVIFSGNDDEREAVNAVRVGAQDYLVKSLSGFEMAARTIRYAIERHRSQAALRQSEEQYRTLSRELEQRVKERTAEIRDLYDNAPSGYHSLDTDGRVVLVNRTEAEWLGYSCEEMIGRSFGDFLAPESRALFQANLSSARQNGSVPDPDCWMLRKDGTRFPVIGKSRFVRDSRGNVIMSRCSLTDNTERKKAEEALRESNEQLSVANIALEKAMRFKDEFLAGMSHELRSPLTAILGLSEALNAGVFGAVSDRHKEPIQDIWSSGKHLLALINDILDLAKIEAGRLELDRAPFDLNEICEASLDLVSGLVQQKGQQVRYSFPVRPVVLQGDARRCRQILVNLLSNAAKFTPAGGELGLEVQADAGGREVRLTVWDKGIGIRQENIGRLFQPFMQIDSSLSREFTGTGLGLSLVRRLTELHGGTVAVESAWGEGSRFTVLLPYSPPASDLPAAAPPAAEPEEVPASEEEPCRRRILIVDDNPRLLRMLAEYLESQHYLVDKVEGGRDLLEKIENLCPDLILMDIQMPGMDGLEAMGHIRRHRDSAIASIPIIAVTALAMTGDRERCLEAGADGYLSKPVQLKDLKGAIQKFLARNPDRSPRPS